MLFRSGPTAFFGLSNVVLRHDLKEKADPVSEAYPHLILNGFETTLGDRISNILKYLFPLPKVDTKRLMTFNNQNDYLSFRHHVYKKGENGHKDVVLKELADLLNGSCRRSDMAARYGGEEFVVILPNTDLTSTIDRKSTRLNSSHSQQSRMPSSA